MATVDVQYEHVRGSIKFKDPVPCVVGRSIQLGFRFHGVCFGL